MSRRYLLILLAAVLACLTIVVAAVVTQDDGSGGVEDPGAIETPAALTGWISVDDDALRLPESDLLDPSAAEPGPGQRAVLVNFWASYCGPCKDELPLLAKYDARERDTSVVGVNLDVSTDAALEAAAEGGITYANYVDPRKEYLGSFRGDMPTSSIPSSVLFVDGRAVAAHIGAFESETDLDRIATYVSAS